MNYSEVFSTIGTGILLAAGKVDAETHISKAESVARHHCREASRDVDRPATQSPSRDAHNIGRIIAARESSRRLKTISTPNG
jgi:hypothetical protein